MSRVTLTAQGRGDAASPARAVLANLMTARSPRDLGLVVLPDQVRLLDASGADADAPDPQNAWVLIDDAGIRGRGPQSGEGYGALDDSGISNRSMGMKGCV